jgi:hypothetical protein
VTSPRWKTDVRAVASHSPDRVFFVYLGRLESAWPGRNLSLRPRGRRHSLVTGRHRSSRDAAVVSSRRRRLVNADRSRLTRHLPSSTPPDRRPLRWTVVYSTGPPSTRRLVVRRVVAVTTCTVVAILHRLSAPPETGNAYAASDRIALRAARCAALLPLVVVSGLPRFPQRCP